MSADAPTPNDPLFLSIPEISEVLVRVFKEALDQHFGALGTESDDTMKEHVVYCVDLVMPGLLKVGRVRMQQNGDATEAFMCMVNGYEDDIALDVEKKRFDLPVHWVSMDRAIKKLQRKMGIYKKDGPIKVDVDFPPIGDVWPVRPQKRIISLLLTIVEREVQENPLLAPYKAQWEAQALDAGAAAVKSPTKSARRF